MSDLISYSVNIKRSRASAVVSLIDAASAGKLSLYTGTRPAITGALPSAALVELGLSNPCGVVNEQAEIVFAAVADAMVVHSGVATWARISDGAGNAIADLDVGLPGSGAAIILADTDLKAGALIRVAMAKLIEP